MLHKRIATAGLAIVLVGSGFTARPAHAQPETAPGYAAPGYAAGQSGWETPPEELSDIQRRGFHDGIEGARKDYDNHRQFDVESRDEFRNPDLPADQRDAYRDGYRRGYELATHHMVAESGPPPTRPWDSAPSEFSDIQRQGFHDGMVGAQKDFDNHRKPDVENREEFRKPHLPDADREAYREGFRRGYQRAMAHLMGLPLPY